MIASAFSPMPRQMALLRFLAGYIEANDGVSPSFCEMAAGIGGVNKSGIHHLLSGLESRGLIARVHGKNRAIRVLKAPAIPRAVDGAPLYFVPVGSGAE